MTLIGTPPDFGPSTLTSLDWIMRDSRTRRVTYTSHFQSALGRPFLLQTLAEMDRRRIPWPFLIAWGARAFGAPPALREARSPRDPERELAPSPMLERRLLAAVRAAAYEPDVHERLAENVRSTHDVLAFCAHALASSDHWLP